MGVGKKLSRLCRLMCGRSLTFRLGVFRTARGPAPRVGEAQRPMEFGSRWGKAATAHQTAKPRTNLNAMARFGPVQQTDSSLLRSFRVNFASGFYKYFVPTGLTIVALILIASNATLTHSRTPG